jgi:hypothetical protein
MFDKSLSLWYSYRRQIKKRPRRIATIPEARTTKGMIFMATQRILRQETKREISRTILREAEHRYRNELLADEEQLALLDRIRRLRKALA